MARVHRNVFPEGGGACGELARSLDWGKTPIGPAQSWSSSLKTMAGTVLFAPHPMLLLWGPEFVALYNDALLSSLRDGGVDTHPRAIGTPYADSWPEAWPIIGPVFQSVVSEAKTIYREDHLIPISRSGRLEEAYWTYSSGPVFDDDLSVGGILAVSNETTDRVLAERRERTLRAIVERLANTPNTSEIVPSAIASLGALRDARWDVPFAVVYEIGEDGVPRSNRTTVDDEEILLALAPAVRRHLEESRTPRGWRTTSTVALPQLAPPNVPWPEPVTQGFIVSISRTAAGPPTEVMVFGLSPRLRFDFAYRTYLEQLADTITQARARHEAYEVRTKAEAERRDLLQQAPVATVLLIGPEHVIEVANETFTELLGRDVVGQTFAQAFPNLVGTEVQCLLQRAYRTGEPFGTNEQLVCLDRKNRGVHEDRWFKFNVQPIRDHDGAVYGMMAVAVDVTEYVTTRQTVERYSADREKLLQAAEAASRAKDEFLAMLGHELRNPLAPITTALHLMKLKNPTALVREREIIGRQAGHLVKLVDDLLDVSRVVRGKVTLNRSRVALADVIARAVETAAPLFEQKRHTLTIDIPNRGLDVDGDPMRLGQIFANLLTNAAKYTEPGGRISVTARRDAALAKIRVEDNGVGIAAAQLPRLFDMFFQVPRASDRAQGGLGLGLAIVKSFVSLHRGTVTVTSNEGAGSVFEVCLPALPYAREGLPDAYVEPQQTRQSRPEKRRVLLVDDSEDILEIVASFLRYEGYEVMEAHDAPDALRIAPSFCPNVAVLDIGLPAMDGYDLAAHLREELGDKAPKMIAMTGYGQEADRERALRAGFAVHLVKPVDPKDLLASVRA